MAAAHAGAGRSGPAAEALTVYEQARTVIADQLGVDPGPEMRKLFQQLLSADVTAAPAVKPAGKKPGRSPVGGAACRATGGAGRGPGASRYGTR